MLNSYHNDCIGSRFCVQDQNLCLNFAGPWEKDVFRYPQWLSLSFSLVSSPSPMIFAPTLSHNPLSLPPLFVTNKTFTRITEFRNTCQTCLLNFPSFDNIICPFYNLFWSSKMQKSWDQIPRSYYKWSVTNWLSLSCLYYSKDPKLSLPISNHNLFPQFCFVIITPISYKEITMWKFKKKKEKVNRKDMMDSEKQLFCNTITKTSNRFYHVTEREWKSGYNRNRLSIMVARNGGG